MPRLFLRIDTKVWEIMSEGLKKKKKNNHYYYLRKLIRVLLLTKIIPYNSFHRNMSLLEMKKLHL